MKTLIVQGICQNNINEVELKQFWIPCMLTVQKWAEMNGWDYKFFNHPLLKNHPFDISSWGQTLRGGTEELTQNQFYKFQWMNGWSDYDYVWWLDADCYIYGNPAIWGDFIDGCYFGNHQILQHRWKRPRMSIWGGVQTEVQRAIDWAVTQFDHPDEQDEILQALRCLNKYPAIKYEYTTRGHLITIPEEGALNVKFTEEIMMAAYTHPREGRGVHVGDAPSHVQGGDEADTGSWREDTIIHFSGKDKYNRLTRFRAYKAYMGYVATEGMDSKFYTEMMKD